MTLDDIYELFTWDQSYTNDEYESRITIGINEAMKYMYLYPFIQPVIPEKAKCIWEPCARVIALKNNEEIKPYLFLLFKWLQGMNWPGAWTIFDRLLKMPFSMMEEEFTYSYQRAEKENDALWLMALKNFKSSIIH